MKTSKTQVLELLVDETVTKAELFNKAFELFRKSDGRLPAQEKHFNRSGFTETTLASVIYELKKLHKVSDAEISKLKKQAKLEASAPLSYFDRFLLAVSQLNKDLALKLLILFKFNYEFAFIQSEGLLSEDLKNYLVDLTPLEELIKIFPDIDNFNEEVPLDIFLEYLKENVNFPEQFLAEIEELRKLETNPASDETIKNPIAPIIDNPEETKVDTESKNQLIELIATAPVEVRQEIKFRDEFPFINDPNLIPELKILVTDKFNHYYAFCNAHKELISRVVLPWIEGKKESESEEQITNDVIFGIAKGLVENFEADQLIYDELLHYKEKGKILGVHPIFKQRVMQDAVDKMTIAEAAKRASNLENYIRRDTKKSEEAKTQEEKQKFSEKVVEWKSELVLVNLKINSPANAGK